MTTEIGLFCPKHGHYPERDPIWPSEDGIAEIEGARAVAFCDSNDYFGFAYVTNDGIHYVRASLHKNAEDKKGKEQDISKPIFFQGDEWVRIVSSGDMSEIHLRHRGIGDSQKVEVDISKLKPDNSIGLF